MKYLSIILLLMACTLPEKKGDLPDKEKRVQVEIITTEGNILVELYNETPLHRDNFLKVMEDQVYDSMLFHRVIDDFIIQTGDITSRNAEPGQQLGASDLPYQVPSEIIDTIFHKRGTLSAARDVNPDYASSSTHFVIIQKGPVPDSLFTKMENWINKNLAVYNFLHADSNAAEYEKAQDIYKNYPWEVYDQFIDSITVVTANKSKVYQFPEEHKAYYRKYGGAPFNDQLYTVFGEVIEGMAVVDSIAKVETDEFDRPLTDVRILSMKVVY